MTTEKALHTQIDDTMQLVQLRMNERQLLIDTLELLRDTARQYVAEGIPLFDSVINQVDAVLKAVK